MSTGAQLIDSLALRTRDVSSFGTTRVQMLDILNRCSYALNAATRSVVASATLTPTEGRLIYATTEVASDVVKVIGVRDIIGRDLLECDLQALTDGDREWPRKLGPRFETFTTIGRDLLVLYPGAKPGQVQNLTVKYVRVPVALADDAVAWTLPEDLEPVLLDLATMVCHLRARIFTPGTAIEEPMARVVKALGLDLAYAKEREGRR